VFAAAVGGLGAVALQVCVALPLGRLALPGAPDWRATGASPAQETRWSAVGNRVIPGPVSAMIALRELEADSRIPRAAFAAVAPRRRAGIADRTPPEDNASRRPGWRLRAASISPHISAVSLSSRVMWSGEGGSGTGLGVTRSYPALLDRGAAGLDD